MTSTRFTLIIGLIMSLSACNLGQTAPTAIPTADLPSAEITFPPNNQDIIEGTVFDIEIIARDSTTGIAKVELYVDENLINEASPEADSVPIFRVKMNWRARGGGQHIIEVIPYRENGQQGDAARVSVNVLGDDDSPAATENAGT